MNKNDVVLKLVNKIEAGQRTYSQTESDLEQIERRFGSLDMLYRVEDRSDREYLQTLLSDAHMGIYSRDSILKMAALNNEASERYRRKMMRMVWIASFAVCVGIFICVYMIQTRR